MTVPQLRYGHPFCVGDRNDDYLTIYASIVLLATTLD